MISINELKKKKPVYIGWENKEHIMKSFIHNPYDIIQLSLTYERWKKIRILFAYYHVNYGNDDYGDYLDTEYSYILYFFDGMLYEVDEWVIHDQYDDYENTGFSGLWNPQRTSLEFLEYDINNGRFKKEFIKKEFILKLKEFLDIK